MKVKDSIAAEFDQFSGNYTEDMTKCVPHYPKLLTCFSDCLPDDSRLMPSWTWDAETAT